MLLLTVYSRVVLECTVRGMNRNKYQISESHFRLQGRISRVGSEAQLKEAMEDPVVTEVQLLAHIDLRGSNTWPPSGVVVVTNKTLVRGHFPSYQSSRIVHSLGEMLRFVTTDVLETTTAHPFLCAQ